MTGTAVVPATPAAVAPAVQGAGTIFDTSSVAMRLYHSFPESEAHRVFELVQTQDKPLSELIGQTIAVEHIVAHSVEMADENGEVVDADRIVLVTPEGVSYGCVSNGVRRSLQMIFALTNSMPPFKPALILSVRQVATRRGFRTFILSPVPSGK